MQLTLNKVLIIINAAVLLAIVWMVKKEEIMASEMFYGPSVTPGQTSVAPKRKKLLSVNDKQIDSRPLKDIAALIEHVRCSVGVISPNGSSNTPDLKRIVKAELNRIDEMLGIKQLRLETFRNLSTTIYDKIEALQNPTNCKEAKKIYCLIPNECGIGCGIGHLLFCMFNAYLYKLMVVILVNGWAYAPGGWDTFYHPLSKECVYEVTNTKEKIFFHYDRNNLTSLPRELHGKMRFLGSNPLPWWYGQLVGHFLRPNDKLNKTLQQTIKNLGFKSPVVG